MEAITPQRRAQLLDRYQSLRRVGVGLSHDLVETLEREAIYEAGERLGLLQGGTFVLDTEDTLAVVMEFALFHVRRDGRNAIQRYLADSPSPPGSDERTLLESLAQAHYRVLEVEEASIGFGLAVRDVLRAESGLLLDVAMSRTAERGQTLAGHIQCLADFWMTTGASLPLKATLFGTLTRRLQCRFGKSPRAFRELSVEQEAQVATWSIRNALDAGMARRVVYR